MYAYILKQVVPVDNSDGYWNDPSVTERTDCVGVTLSREYASEWLGREVKLEDILLLMPSRKSVERVELLPSRDG